MKFSYLTANLIFLITLLILPIFDRLKIGEFQAQESLSTWYSALSHNFPTNKKSKESSSNKCNKIIFLGNLAEKISECQTKATLEVKTYTVNYQNTPKKNLGSGVIFD